MGRPRGVGFAVMSIISIEGPNQRVQLQEQVQSRLPYVLGGNNNRSLCQRVRSRHHGQVDLIASQCRRSSKEHAAAVNQGLAVATMWDR